MMMYPNFCRFCGKILKTISVYDSKEHCPFCWKVLRDLDMEYIKIGSDYGILVKGITEKEYT